MISNEIQEFVRREIRKALAQELPGLPATSVARTTDKLEKLDGVSAKRESVTLQQVINLLNTLSTFTLANGAVTFLSNGITQLGNGNFSVDAAGNAIFSNMVPTGDDISIESDLRFTTQFVGPVLVAPNSSKWRIIVSNAGALSTQAA